MVSHLPCRRLRERWCNAAEFNGNILFPRSHSNSNSDVHSDPNTNSHPYGNADTDGKSHTDADRNADAVHRQMYSNTAAAPYTSASPVVRPASSNYSMKPTPPVGQQSKCDCHDTLLWLIYFSLDCHPTMLS